MSESGKQRKKKRTQLVVASGACCQMVTTCSHFFFFCQYKKARQWHKHIMALHLQPRRLPWVVMNVQSTKLKCEQVREKWNSISEFSHSVHIGTFTCQCSSFYKQAKFISQFISNWYYIHVVSVQSLCSDVENFDFFNRNCTWPKFMHLQYKMQKTEPIVRPVVKEVTDHCMLK